MQRLTDAPRQDLTEAQVRALLVSADTEWSSGAELVTASGRVDISADLAGGTVEWNGDQDIHRSCQIQLSRELAWGRDQLGLFRVGRAVTGFEDVTRVARHGVVATNLSPDPRATAIHGSADAGTLQVGRWGTYTTYSLGSGAVTPDGIGTYLRGTVTGAHSSLGFHVASNPESGVPGPDSGLIPVTPGVPFTVSVLLDVSAATQWRWGARYVASGAWVGGNVAQFASVPAGQWVRVTATYTPPAGVDHVSLYVVCQDTLPAGATFDGTGLSITGAPGYFDGDTPDTADFEYAWTGTPNASTSTKTAITTTVTREPVIVEARFDRGVFVLSTPQYKPGETPMTFDVAGEDRLALLARPRGDVTTVDPGAGYLAAAKALIDAENTGGTVRFDGTAQDKVLDPAGDGMSWRLTESEQPTTLRIVNDLLDAVGYEHVWADEHGDFRASPLVPDSTRPVEWEFDADDERYTIVGTERTATTDVWRAPNSWRFIASGLSFPPEEGNGQYTPPPYQSGGPSSIDALGYVNPKIVFLDAVDQDALVAQGDAIVAADKRIAWQLDMTSYPFPLAGHRDVATYSEAALGGLRKVVAASWVEDLGRPGQPPADTQWTFEQA